MRFAVDPWDPGYGTSVDDDLAESSARLDVAVELAADDWRPVPVPSGTAEPAAVLFVDGVRRIDAHAWIETPLPDGPLGADSVAGLCASYAAGVLCCCAGRSHLVAARVRHRLVTTATHATGIVTSAGTYDVLATPATQRVPEALTLSNALQRSLSELEAIVSAEARTARSDDHAGVAADDDLLVVDGPLHKSAALPRALGFVKTHRTRYLPPELNAVVAGLAAGERSPVFLIGTHWDRYTWYLRLPTAAGPPGHPWAGIARVECAASSSAAEAVAFAALSQVVLPRFASVEYKDSRAPQNLFPIAGLERELRRRLGDPRLLYRALRTAAAAPVGGA